MPTGLGGFWCSWLPFALPQFWPFCWWIAMVQDHFSRKALGVAVFKNEPSGEETVAFLDRVVRFVLQRQRRRRAPRPALILRPGVMEVALDGPRLPVGANDGIEPPVAEAAEGGLVADQFMVARGDGDDADLVPVPAAVGGALPPPASTLTAAWARRSSSPGGSSMASRSSKSRRPAAP
jgi:hypothetical protein